MKTSKYFTTIKTLLKTVRQWPAGKMPIPRSTNPTIMVYYTYTTRLSLICTSSKINETYALLILLFPSTVLLLLLVFLKLQLADFIHNIYVKNTGLR